MTEPEEETTDLQYIPYGDGIYLFDLLDGTIPKEEAPRECLFEGVAGLGKSRLMGEWVKAVCNMYPDSKGLVLRETRVSLNDSFLDIWENQVLGFNHPAVLNGPTKEHRDFYRNPALGGEVMLGGMDNPTKLFSTQYDWIFFNECQETTEEKWESLHRALRGSVRAHAGGNALPFRILLGDCNPDHEYHWLNQRANTDRLHRLVGRFWDNPLFYDWEKKEWTDLGKDYLDRLNKNLTGPRHDRLYRGKWVAAEGQIWPDYDPRVHLVTGKLSKEEGRHFLHIGEWHDEDPVELLWFLGGQDIGHAAPGCAQVWGFDRAGRAFRIAEVYRTHWDHNQWAEVWKEFQAEFQPMKAILTDWDPAFRKSINQRLNATEANPIAIPWAKLRGPGQEKVGIDDVRIRMKPRADGTRGFYLLRDCHRYWPDPELKEKRQPTCFEEEIPGWVYTRPKDGQKQAQSKKDDPDPTCPDHACFPAGTMVRLRNASNMAIEHIKPGMEVMTPEGWGEVVECGEMGDSQSLVAVETDLGMLIGTKDHPVWTLRGWVPLGELDDGRDIVGLLWEGQEGTNPNFQSGEVTNGIDTQRTRSGPLGAISEEGQWTGTSTFTVPFGNQSTDRSLMDISSITSTIIRGIMTRGTSPVSLEESINPTILCQKKDVPSLSTYSIDIGTRHQRGIAPLKGENGIVEMVSLLASVIRRESPRPASPARLTSRVCLGRSIVLAAVRSVRDLPGEKQPVFNLKVEPQGVYFANGWLVSNCDAARGVLSWSELRSFISPEKVDRWGGDTYGAMWTKKLKGNKKKKDYRWEKRQKLILPSQLQ